MKVTQILLALVCEFAGLNVQPAQAPKHIRTADDLLAAARHDMLYSRTPSTVDLRSARRATKVNAPVVAPKHPPGSTHFAMASMMADVL